MGLFQGSLFFDVVLGALSSLVIILLRKRDLTALLCIVAVSVLYLWSAVCDCDIIYILVLIVIAQKPLARGLRFKYLNAT